MARRGRERNEKYLRLTGMWESKKGGLFTGRVRPDELEKLIEQAEESVKNEVPLIFFLWEQEKDGRKDPDFVLQSAVGEEENDRSSRGRKGRDEEKEEEEEEEKPSRRGRSRGRDDDDEKKSSKKSDKQNSDW